MLTKKPQSELTAGAPANGHPPLRAPAPAASQRRLSETLRIALPVLLLAAGVAGYAVLAAQHEVVQRETPPVLPPLVETIVIEPASGGLDLEADGMVVPYREIKLAAEVPGRVRTKSADCRAGRYVTRGTLLAEIDPRDYELEVERLQRDFDQAGTLLEELDVEIANAREMVQLAEEEIGLQRRDLARIEQLNAGRVATDSQLDEARRKELAARNAQAMVRNQAGLLGTRRARLESARQLVATQIEKARLDLERTRITAPLSGVIVREMIEQDAFLQKGDPIVAIEDTSRVEVKCNLRMDELFWLWKQSPAAAPSALPGAAPPRAMPLADHPQPLEVPALPGSAVQPAVGSAPASDLPLSDDNHPTNLARDYQLPRVPATVEYQLGGRRYEWQGTLDRYDGIGLDEQTRTVPCRVVVPEPRRVKVSGTDGPSPHGPPALVRGMYVTVRIHARPDATLVRIPERAVRPGDVVWRVRDGKLDIVSDVEIAEIVGDTALVDTGSSQLKSGDKVVISPLAVATQGMKLREKPQP